MKIVLFIFIAIYGFCGEVQNQINNMNSLIDKKNEINKTQNKKHNEILALNKKNNLEIYRKIFLIEQYNQLLMNYIYIDQTKEF